MRRIGLVICVLAAGLVFAASALGIVRHFTGTVAEGGTVDFNATFKHRHYVKVTGFAWTSVPLTCDQGTSTVSGQFTFPMRVNSQRKFHASGTATTSVGEIHANVAGTFSTKRKAHGTFHNFGDFDSNHTNCDSGADTWTAHLGQ